MLASPGMMSPLRADASGFGGAVAESGPAFTVAASCWSVAWAVTSGAEPFAPSDGLMDVEEADCEDIAAAEQAAGQWAVTATES